MNTRTPQQIRAAYRAAMTDLTDHDPIAIKVARHKGRQAALASLPASCRIWLTEDALRDFQRAVEAGIEAWGAHLMSGKPEQDERAFEQIHDIPTPREFTVIDGGRRVESARESEGEVRS